MDTYTRKLWNADTNRASLVGTAPRFPWLAGTPRMAYVQDASDQTPETIYDYLEDKLRAMRAAYIVHTGTLERAGCMVQCLEVHGHEGRMNLDGVRVLKIM